MNLVLKKMIREGIIKTLLREVDGGFQPEEEIHICPGCKSPSRGNSCDNPGCFENPRVSPKTKAEWKARIEKDTTEKAERDMINRARNASYGNYIQEGFLDGPDDEFNVASKAYAAAVATFGKDSEEARQAREKQTAIMHRQNAEAYNTPYNVAFRAQNDAEHTFGKNSKEARAAKKAAIDAFFAQEREKSGLPPETAEDLNGFKYDMPTDKDAGKSKDGDEDALTNLDKDADGIEEVEATGTHTFDKNGNLIGPDGNRIYGRNMSPEQQRAYIRNRMKIDGRPPITSLEEPEEKESISW